MSAVSAGDGDHSLFIDPTGRAADEHSDLFGDTAGDVGEAVSVDAHVQCGAATLIRVKESRWGIRTHPPADVGRRQLH